MSYGRYPVYIWSDGDRLHFDLERVPEEHINAFLYKILLTNQREELAERLREGKAFWDTDPFGIYEEPERQSEREDLRKQREEQEDIIVRKLMWGVLTREEDQK